MPKPLQSTDVDEYVEDNKNNEQISVQEMTGYPTDYPPLPLPQRRATVPCPAPLLDSEQNMTYDSLSLPGPSARVVELTSEPFPSGEFSRKVFHLLAMILRKANSPRLLLSAPRRPLLGRALSTYFLRAASREPVSKAALHMAIAVAWRSSRPSLKAFRHETDHIWSFSPWIK